MKDNIIKALERDSSFTFEMEVLQLLTDNKFTYEHSGLYLDPYTKKNREFDIRARKDVKENCHINLAVECKKIDEQAPLIIHSTMIPRNDRTHSLIINYSNFKIKSDNKNTSGNLSHHNYLHSLHESPMSKGYNYQVHYRQTQNGTFPSLTSCFEYVGRSMDQLKPKTQGQSITYSLNDSEVFEKFSQAQNSLVDLIEESYNYAYKESEIRHQFFNLPILVVPNNSLWEQQYKANGQKNGEPREIDRIPFYINKTYNNELHQFTPKFFLRFMEVVTFDGLAKLLHKMLSVDDGFENSVFLSVEDELNVHINQIFPKT